MNPCCRLGPAQGGAEGEGLLDVYLVSASGQRPVRLFVNHYTAGPVHAPIEAGKSRETAGLLMIALAATAGDERAAQSFARFEQTEPAALIARVKQSVETLAEPADR